MWYIKKCIYIIVILLFFNIGQFTLIDHTKGDLIDPSSLVAHPPIQIQDDLDFLPANGVIAGNGSSLDPYIIENWTVDASTSNGIYIKDTRAHFIIRNCNISNSYGSSHASVYLLNVTNGLLEYNRISNNYDGLKIEYSEALKIRHTDVFEGWAGISLHETRNLTFENVTVYNSWMSGGFKAVNSQEILIDNVTIYNNDYGFLIWASNDIMITDSLIADNSEYGVEISNSKRIAINNSSIHGNGEDGIFFEDSQDVTIRKNIIYSNVGGISAYNKNDKCEIRENIIYDNIGGMSLRSVNECLIVDNEILNNSWYGLLLYRRYDDSSGPVNNTFFNNHIYGSEKNFGYHWNQYPSLKNNIITPNNTVNGKPIYIWIKEKNKEIPIDAGYVALIECSNITIQELTLRNNFQGIVLESSKDIVIESNIITNVMKGIDVYNSSPRIIDNEIFNVSLGISLQEVNGVTIIKRNEIHDITAGFNENGGIWIHSSSANQVIISNNILFNLLKSFWHSFGIHVENAEDVKIYDNAINNSDNGLLLDNVKKVNITRNNIAGNMIGINLINPAEKGNILIYNNIFNNNEDYSGAVDTCKWNSSKMLIRNIVGGIFQGGNYWSDYHGIDLDGDYLGDTELPFGPGDYHPLILAPIIIDQTLGSPMTNRTFEINVTVFYELEIINVTITYWIALDPYLTKEMSLIKGNNIDGNYSTSVEIPRSAEYLEYLISAWTDEGKIAETSLITIHVIDVEKPTIEDYSGTPITGMDFLFDFIIHDNIEVEDLKLEYRFDNGSNSFINLNYHNKINIPSKARILHYTLFATDIQGNVAIHEMHRNIIDIIPPEIAPQLTRRPRTDEEFIFKCNITDNWAVYNVTIEYWFESKKESSGMVKNDTVYEYPIVIPLNATILYYSIKALDWADNSQYYNNSLPVLDNNPPQIIDMTRGEPKAGETFTIQFVANDNFGIKFVYVEFWFKGEKEKVFLDLIDNRYIGSISVPLSAKEIHYVITAEDDAGNKAVTAEKTLKVEPSNTSSIWIWYIFTLISIVIIIVLTIFIYKRFRS